MAYEGKQKDAKINALKNLKSSMNQIGGSSLSESLKKDEYNEGGVVKASVIAKDKEGLEEGLKKAAEIVEEQEDDDEFSSMSREDMIKLLKNR